MARETKAARTLRLEAVAHTVLEAEAAFMAQAPLHLFKLKELASQASVHVRVDLLPKGFTVAFEFEYGDEVLTTFDSESWEFEQLRLKLDEKLAEKEARNRRLLLAQEALSLLSNEQLAALKEFGFKT